MCSGNIKAVSVLSSFSACAIGGTNLFNRYLCQACNCPYYPFVKGEIRVKIADVAKKARVSEATVSRALNNPEIVTPELLKRVNESVRALRYRPNPHAKSLAGLTSPSVGILLFDEVGEVFRSPFWAQAISSLYCFREISNAALSSSLKIYLGKTKKLVKLHS
jgi:hypothetical protein